MASKPRNKSNYTSKSALINIIVEKIKEINLAYNLGEQDLNFRDMYRIVGSLQKDNQLNQSLFLTISQLLLLGQHGLESKIDQNKPNNTPKKPL
jgi:hypothetical protein